MACKKWCLIISIYKILKLEIMALYFMGYTITIRTNMNYGAVMVQPQEQFYYHQHFTI